MNNQCTEVNGARYPLRSRSDTGKTERDEERCEREGGRKEETEIGSKIVLRRDETRKNLFRADGRMGDLMKTGGGLFARGRVNVEMYVTILVTSCVHRITIEQTPHHNRYDQDKENGSKKKPENQHHENQFMNLFDCNSENTKHTSKTGVKRKSETPFTLSKKLKKSKKNPGKRFPWTVTKGSEATEQVDHGAGLNSESKKSNTDSNSEKNTSKRHE